MDELIYFVLASTLGLMVAIGLVGPKRVFNPRHMGGLYLFIMYITFVARPALTFVAGDGTISLEHLLPGISLRILADLQPFMLAFIVSLVAFAIGYRSVPHPGWNRRDLALVAPDSQYHSGIVWFALILIVAGYASFFFARRGFAGLADNTITMVDTGGGTVFTNTTGYIELANYLVISGTLLYYAGTSRLWPAVLLAIPWTYNQIYFGWSRYMIVALYVGLFGAWLVSRREQKRSRWQSITVVALAIATLSYVILVRSDRFFLQQGSSFQYAAQRSLAQTPDDVLGDLAGFEGSWYVLTTLDNRSPNYGANILYQYFIKPIPRLLWPGKPLPLDFTWQRIFGLPEEKPATLEYSDAIWFSGPVKGSIGYAAEDWGWLGFILNFGLTGIFLAWIERKGANAGKSVVWYAVYGATYAMIVVLGRVDIFRAGLNQFLLFYLPYLFIHWWLTQSPHIIRRQRRQRRRAALDALREQAAIK